jgi:predicted enzyme related to lactoylglutathione lyase
MSERDGYQPGVPCWVDLLAPDPGAAMAFYGELLGWEFDGPGPGDYYEAQLRGRHVAGIGAQPPGVPTAWNTYVAVTSAEDGARAAAAAGGRVVIEPFDALPAGRVAVLEDPAGAAVGLWEPRDRKGAQLVNEPSAWSMSMLLTSDADGCAAFYRQVFGWKTDAFVPGVQLFRLPGCVAGEPQQPVPRDVVAVMAPADDGSFWSVGFWVDDADAVADNAARLGGSVIAPPSDAAGMRQAVLADPAGAAFSVTTAPGPH